MSDGVRKHLIRRLIVGMALLLSISAAIPTVIIYQVNLRTAAQRADHKLDTMGIYLKGSLRQPMWELNVPVINYVGNLMINDPSVVALMVKSDTDEILFQSRTQHVGEIVSGHFNVKDEDQLFGHFEVEISKAFYEKAASENIQSILYILALQLLIFLVIAGLMIRILLRQPFERMEGVLKQYASGNYDVVAQSGYIEFEPIDNVLSDMGHRLFVQINKLEDYHNNLEKVVSERTSELDAANKQLQELDKLKSMFIASMSHELRTPLNSIIGFSGLILQGETSSLQPDQKDGLERINRAGNHLLGLISDVIDISKIEADRIELFIEPFPLKELVEEAVETIKVQADAKGIALEIVADAWPIINTDRKRLLQCLLNYLSNAVKFTEAGKVSLFVSVDDEAVDIHVTDTGIGIAETDLPKLFEAFERLESHLRIKAGGTGLGLYLTKKIVEGMLHGKVYVKSQVNVGSTFGLSVPLATNDIEEENDHDS